MVPVAVTVWVMLPTSTRAVRYFGAVSFPRKPRTQTSPARTSTPRTIAVFFIFCQNPFHGAGVPGAIGTGDANPRPKITSGALRPSVSSSLAFLRRQDLQTRRPPAGPHRLDEFRRQPFRLHFPGERLEVVGDRHELDLDLPAESEARIPDVRAPVVGGPAEDARVDDEAPRRKPPRPVEPGVRADEDVRRVGR